MPQCGGVQHPGCDVVRLIKRYDSRKLYDTEESRYVSLEELGGWIREGQEIRVVDNATSDDVTAQTLTQVILEESRRGTAVPPSEILHALIRQGGEWVTSGVAQLNQGVDRLISGRCRADRPGAATSAWRPMSCASVSKTWKRRSPGSRPTIEEQQTTDAPTTQGRTKE